MPDSTTPHAAGLDLDELEEDGAVRKPYDFKAGGQTFTAYDPDRMDWLTIANLDGDDPRTLLQTFLTKEDYAEFVQLEPTPATWKVKRLVRSLNRHFYGAEKPAGE